MSYDYGPILTKAKALVAKYGRTITLSKLGSPSDPTKPWAAPASPTTATYSAVSVDPSSYAKLGINLEVLDFMKKTQLVYVIATSDDLSSYQKVIDGGQTFSIVGQTYLRPGDTTLLWYIGAGG